MFYLDQCLRDRQGVLFRVLFGNALQPHQVAVPTVDDRPVQIEGDDLLHPSSIPYGRAMLYLLISIWIFLSHSLFLRYQSTVFPIPSESGICGSQSRRRFAFPISAQVAIMSVF